MGKVIHGKWSAPSPESPQEQAQRLLGALERGHFVPAWAPTFTHKGCGGALVEDWDVMYRYESDDGKVSEVPSIVCTKCRAEITGDLEIDYEQS